MLRLGAGVLVRRVRGQTPAAALAGAVGDVIRAKAEEKVRAKRPPRKPVAKPERAEEDPGEVVDAEYEVIE